MSLILIVDDDASIRLLLRRMLDRSGWKILEAASAAEASQQMDLHGGGVILALVDKTLPDFDGLELAEQWIGDFPALKIIMMSGYALDVSAPGRQGRMAFLQKPFLREALLSALAAAGA